MQKQFIPVKVKTKDLKMGMLVAYSTSSMCKAILKVVNIESSRITFDFEELHRTNRAGSLPNSDNTTGLYKINSIDKDALISS
jgi:hypothetical protein